MKFTDRGNNVFTIEGITDKDIKYSNLSAKPTNSIYYNPDKPQHVLVIWLPTDVADAMVAAGFGVNQAEDSYNNEGVKPFIQLKAYPKVRPNRVNGRSEQYPKVILKTSENTIRLTKRSFGLFDSAHVKNVDISFHQWVYDDHRNPVCVLDGLWCTADESAGGRNDYFDSDYGYEEPEFDPEEVPFD